MSTDRATEILAAWDEVTRSAQAPHQPANLRSRVAFPGGALVLGSIVLAAALALQMVPQSRPGTGVTPTASAAAQTGGLAFTEAPSLQPRPASAAPSPSSAAREWTEPSHYLYTLRSRCGEQNLIGRFRVEVRDHAVVHIEGLDAQGRNVASFIEPELVPTLAGLLERAAEARAEGAYEVTLELDPRDGNPTFLRIDRHFATIDDEECYTVSDVMVVVHARL